MRWQDLRHYVQDFRVKTLRAGGPKNISKGRGVIREHTSAGYRRWLGATEGSAADTVVGRGETHWKQKEKSCGQGMVATLAPERSRKVLGMEEAGRGAYG